MYAGKRNYGTVPPARPFLVWKPFKAGGPPAAGDGFNELRGQAFGRHFSGQLMVVVIDRNEFHFHVCVFNCQQRVPHVRRAVVLRPAQDSHVQEVPVAGERALLAELEGGCQVPVGAWARFEDGGFVIDSCVVAPDGSEYIRLSARATAEEMQDRRTALRLGRELGRRLIEAGADRILRLLGRTP